jgi:hypothetical protein
MRGGFVAGAASVARAGGIILPVARRCARAREEISSLGGKNLSLRCARAISFHELVEGFRNYALLHEKIVVCIT